MYNLNYNPYYLTDSDAIIICNLLRHPNLSSLNLSSNPDIGPYCGDSVVNLINRSDKLKVLNLSETDIQNKISTKKEFIKGKIQKIISSLNFLSRRNNIACKTTYLNFYNEIKLNLLNKDFPSILQNQSYHTKKINLELRNKINIKNDTNDKFEKILRNLIPNSLPKTIVENYSIIFDKTHKCNWPSKPKVIFTSNSYDGDDFFKIWTAYQVEKNNSKYGTRKK